MQKLFLSLSLLVFILSSCLKDSNSNQKCNYVDTQIVAPDSEQQAIQHYLDSTGITASKNSNGIFYKINEQGSGAGIVNLCSIISVNYKGRLTNGNVFDSTATGNSASFQLGRAIPGWQKGLPLISKGGKIVLIIPPSLGYGAFDQKDTQGNIIIPGNSILIFDIELVDIS